MKRRHPREDEPTLFDPPLRPEPDLVDPPLHAEPTVEQSPAEKPALAPPEPAPPQPHSLPLFPELEEGGDDPELDPPPAEPTPPPGDLPLATAETEGPPGHAAEPPVAASLRLRLLAGLADLTVHGAVLLLVLVGMSWAGISWRLEQWPGLVIFLVTFSFLYTVVPLAFWGQTPGMSAAGIEASTVEGDNLSFPQTAARWAAGLLTVLLFGLPLLLALGGASLGDRMSASLTRRVPS